MNKNDNTAYETEFEGDEKEPSFEGPFEPKDIDVDISVVNLGFLLDQLENNEIDLSPEFQRSSNVWTKEKKSQLIESVLLGLPLPSFYFSEDVNTNKLVVVDGLQRLCAFKEFCFDEQKLKLEGLNFLNLNGKTFDELDRAQIRSMKSLKITMNTLRKGTPIKVKYILFQRINTAGVPLNQQEMRNALYQGKATLLLKKMAESVYFKKATDNRVSSKRMADCDFANRFLAFYLRSEQYKGELDSFMADALELINKMDVREIDSLFDSFDDSMRVCYQLLGNNAFRRPNPKKTDSYMKVNKAIFEVLSVSIAKLTIEQKEILITRKELFCSKIYALFTNTEFIQSVTSGTARETQTKYRFSKINELINSVLTYDN